MGKKSFLEKLISAGVKSYTSTKRAAAKDAKERERQARANLQKTMQHQAKVQSFSIEYPRRKQILDESIRLIETTNSLTTINGRYNTVIKQYQWVIKQHQDGMPVTFYEESCGFVDSINREFNNNVLRIVKFIYNKDIESINKTKNKDSRQNKITKLREIISNATIILKVHENKHILINELKTISDRVNETIKE